MDESTKKRAVMAIFGANCGDLARKKQVADGLM